VPFQGYVVPHHCFVVPHWCSHIIILSFFWWKHDKIC
jgi:hypothetical protein